MTNQEKILKRITLRIFHKTSDWNGWHFEDESRMRHCLKLAKSILKTVERETNKKVSEAKP